MALELKLPELQKWMQGVVVAPGAIGDAVASQGTAVPPERLAEVILPSRSLEPADRLEIYQGMYPLRMEEALASDYPALKHLLGDEKFMALVEAYVEPYPSRSFTLNRLGANLVQFIDEEAKLPRRAMLADMARLEWAVAQAYDADESEVLTDEDVAKVPEEAWVTARIVPTPSFRLLSLGHDVQRYLETHKSETHDHPPIRKKESHVVVFRRTYSVFHLGLSRQGHALLADIAAGKTLGEAIEAALKRKGRPTADQLFGWFRSWVGERMFRKVELSP